MIKKAIFSVIILLLFVFTYAQNPVLVRDSPKYEEAYSCFLNLGDKSVISFASQYHDQLNNIHISFDNQFIINQNGKIEKSLIVDSCDYSTYGVMIGAMIKRQNYILQFGGLYGINGKNFSMLIRRVDTNLILISDTIFNLGNRVFSISDVIDDGPDMLLCGSVYDSLNSDIFVFRLNDSLQIVDSVYIPIQSSFFFNSVPIVTHDNELQLRISSRSLHAELLYKLNTSNLSVIDTLYSMLGLAWYIPNGYPLLLDDTFYLTTICSSMSFGQYPNDTSFYKIGWLKWDSLGSITDTIFPLKDSLFSDFVGLKKTMVMLGEDSIAVGYSHNFTNHGIPSDSTSVGVLYSSVSGLPRKMVYLGAGYNYTLENLMRFDNGNLLILVSRRLYQGNSFTKKTGFIAWLLDGSGNIIERFTLSDNKDYSIKLYPNPATDIMNIALISMNQHISDCQIIGLQGKTILYKQLHSKQAKIDVSKLAAGVYIIQGQTTTGAVFRRKFIKN